MPIFESITEIIKFKSSYGFRGRSLNIREVCMNFEPCFKVHNSVSGYPKGMKLGQMTNLNVIFHVVVSVYRLVTISNSPQFSVEFRNGLWFAYRKLDNLREIVQKNFHTICPRFERYKKFSLDRNRSTFIQTFQFLRKTSFSYKRNKS